jgi:hypothetical protein
MTNYKANAWTRIEDAIRRIKPYYESNPGGGTLHVVLDDGNMEAGNILDCWQYAKDEGDKAALDLIAVLIDMSVDERYELYDRYDDYAR